MTKQLYVEALADVQALKEAAINDAKRSVIEAVVPRLKELIEQQLLSEESPMNLSREELLGGSLDVEEVPPQDPIQAAPLAAKPPVAPKVDQDNVCCEPCVDTTPVGVDVPLAPAVSPDAQIEPTDVLDVLVPVEPELEESVKKLEAKLVSIRLTGRRLNESTRKNDRINSTLVQVKDMYDRIQRTVEDRERKGALELRLERVQRKLLQLKESTMRRLREADEDLDLGGAEETEEGGKELTIKVKGLDVDPVALDDATVELVADESEEVGDEEDMDLDLDMGDESAPEGGELEGEEGDDEELELTDESVLEIDESVLRAELKRMRKLNETKDAQKPVAKKGDKPGPKEFDDFGDAKSEGEPLKVKLTTEGEECDECSEAKEDETEDPKELLQRESRLRTVWRRKLSRVQKALTEARGTRRVQLKKVYADTQRKIEESKDNSRKHMRRLAEARVSDRSNTGSQDKNAKSLNEEKLRKQLAESNLLNVKLAFTNKLLQNETLTARQKAAIIERLDEAKSEKEAKLVYESLLKKVSKNESKLTESRVLGSSSQPTRSASTQEQQLDESVETARWAQLAGLNKLIK